MTVEERLAAKEAEVRAQLEELTGAQEGHARAALARCRGESEPLVVDRSTAVTAHESLGRLLEEVRLARTRLDEGSSGRCAVCGGPIPEGRLEARPWATTCLRHG